MKTLHETNEYVIESISFDDDRTIFELFNEAGFWDFFHVIDG